MGDQGDKLMVSSKCRLEARMCNVIIINLYFSVTVKLVEYWEEKQNELMEIGYKSYLLTILHWFWTYRKKKNNKYLRTHI